MEQQLPSGLTPLTEQEMLAAHGGGLLGWLGAAIGFGLKAGQWIVCAFECVLQDA